VLRAFGLGSLPWLIELTEYLIYAGTFIAAPWVLRQGGHVRVDILLVSLPKPLASRLEQFVNVLGLCVSIVMTYYGARAVANAYVANMVQFKTWAVAEWILLLPIPISCTLLALEFALRALRVAGHFNDDYTVTDRPSV
jgi:TRAP-type C4-dicarboxylate transport system permease small subunit